ncbi:hypothetical protein ABEB36_008853 [Hypothenemus hampei]
MQFELFNEGKWPSKRRLYDNVASILEKKGYQYSSVQCENKWKSLKRRYMSKHERLIYASDSSRCYQTRNEFEDRVKDIMKIERFRAKRRHEETIKDVNLNIPPGFSATDCANNVSEPEEITLFTDSRDNYTHTDENMIKSDDYLILRNTAENFNNEITTENVSLANEVQKLTEVVKESLDANTKMIKIQTAIHKQLLVHLDKSEKKEEERKELKRRKLEKQSELIQQIKIQNSLIAKLIQNISNNGRLK